MIDPSSRSVAWLKEHMKAHKLEVVSQGDANFLTQVELAVRFGKTLIVEEVMPSLPLLLQCVGVSVFLC